MKKQKFLLIVLFITLSMFIATLFLIKPAKTDTVEVPKHEDQMEQIATEFVQANATLIENNMKESGITDAKIVCIPCSKEKYIRDLTSTKSDGYYDDYDNVEHTYYYQLRYESDEIADIFNKKIEKKEEEDLLTDMFYLFVKRYADRLCYRPDSYVAYEYVDGYYDEIAVYVDDGHEQGELSFITSDGHIYGYRDVYEAEELFIDDKVIYTTLEEDTVEEPPEYERTDKYQPTGEYFDPYDVEQYEDGDDFAEEWAEEFGDGDYDSGYDDAYDYWESESGY